LDHDQSKLKENFTIYTICTMQAYTIYAMQSLWWLTCYIY